MTTSRTDQHRPSTFVPGEYEYVTAIDCTPTMGLDPRSMADPAVKAYIEFERERYTHYSALMTGDHRSLSQCNVCGAHYRWAIVWKHTSGDHISTGEDCAATIDAAQAGAATRDVRGLAKAAADYGRLARTRQAFSESHPRADEAVAHLYETVAAVEAGREFWRAEHPPTFDTEEAGVWLSDEFREYQDALARAVPPEEFTHSLYRAYRKYGRLTDAQLAAVLRSIDTAPERAAQQAQRAQEREAREARAAASRFVGEVGGRLTMTLRLQSVRRIESKYGESHLHAFEDENGNQVRWFASGLSPFRHQYQFTADAGDWTQAVDSAPITVKATVKAHETYKGIEQTVVARVAEVPS